MNVRQNRAPTKGETEIPDTRITVEDVRTRLYILAHDRGRAGDKRAARLREWLDSPESGRAGFAGRGWESNGQIEKAITRAGMRVLGLSAQSKGASGVASAEDQLGISPAQVEILRQPLPATIRRLPSEESDNNSKQRLLRISLAIEAFVGLLTRELAHIDKAAQGASRAKTAAAKNVEEQDKLFAKYEALREKYADTGYQEESAEGVRANDAYNAWLKGRDRGSALETRSEDAYRAWELSLRPSAWVEIFTLARWMLAWSAAVTVKQRLVIVGEIYADDSEQRGVYPALEDALFGIDGILGGDAGVSLTGVFLPRWAKNSSEPLTLGDDKTASFTLKGWGARLNRFANRLPVADGGWKPLVERVNTLLLRVDYFVAGFIAFHGAGKQKNVPVLIGRPLVPDRGDIAGFRVSVYGMGLFAERSFQGFYEKVSELIPLSLRIVREQAQRYFPALLREYKPAHTIFNLVPAFDPPSGAYYRHGQTVLLYLRQHRRAKSVAKTWVHEAGHHIWTDYLPPAKRQVWIDAVEQNAPYDLTILLDAMRAAQAVKVWDSAVFSWLKDNNGYLYVLTQRLVGKYVYEQRDTSLGGWQAGDAVGGLTRDTTLEEVEAMIAAKEAAGEAPLVYFKGLPTTQYGATNVEEGWCEAFSYYIVYGPDSVLPQLRAAMRRLLPDMRRNPDDEDDANDES